MLSIAQFENIEFTAFICFSDRIVLLGEWGFPLTYLDLRLVVKGYLDKQGRTVRKFKNNLPGEDWVISFLKRHKKQLSSRMSQNIKRARAAVSAQTVNKYFDNLEETLSGVQPCSIVNYDETNLTDDPGNKKIICRRGQKHPEKVNDFAKSATSLMFSCSGDGKLLPTYVLYKAENLYDSWRVGGPKGSRYGCTKSGWFDQKHFEDWFFQVAVPYLKKQPEPRVLIGDNLSSHFSESVLTSCVANGIFFTMLPKHSTHLAQPLDVAFFRPLKCKWRSLLQEWRNNGNKGSLSKIHFPPMLKKLLESLEDKCEDKIKSGFKKTGIVPVDRQQVLDQLPNKGVEANPVAVGEDMDDSVVGLLRQLRYGNENPRPRTSRRDKLSVEPGKSVKNVGEDESETEEVEEEDGSGSEGGSFENNVDDPELQEPAESPGSGNESEDAVEEIESQTTVDYMSLIMEDFLVIKLNDQITKREKLYCAQVSEIKENSSGTSRVVEVTFLKQYRAHRDTFVFPEIEEKSIVYPHEIWCQLKQPKKLRYGRLQFPKNLF